jgi:hypothetical protein
MQLSERTECVQELSDLFVAAKNVWPIGALLTGTDPLLEEFEKLRPSQIDGGAQRELLGRNFLGAEAWRSQGIDVGDVPPVPSSITKDFLNSECPIHPGHKIKDTHVLMLVPKTVNGEPYTALKLDELCATRKGSGDKLIYDGWSSWKTQRWAIPWPMWPPRG